MSRWPRFVELSSGSRARQAMRDRRNIQRARLARSATALSIGMDGRAMAGERSRPPAPCAEGRGFSEEDKQALRDKQLELLARRIARIPPAPRNPGRSKFPLRRTIIRFLPLLCDTDIADVNRILVVLRSLRHFSIRKMPASSFAAPANITNEFSARHPMVCGLLKVRCPNDALRSGCRDGIQMVCHGRRRAGPHARRRVWPRLAGNSVRTPSGSTLPCEFSAAAARSPDFFAITISPIWSDSFTAAWARRPRRRISTTVFAQSASACQGGQAVTVSIILDGENAWEYFPGNGREFLRQFYRRIEADPDIQALTATEALAAARGMCP